MFEKEFGDIQMAVNDGFGHWRCLIRTALFIDVRSTGDEFPDRIHLSFAGREVKRGQAANVGGSERAAAAASAASTGSGRACRVSDRAGSCGTSET